MEKENMNMFNFNAEKDYIAFSCDAKEIELPKDIQKRMLEFFVQTSIPRKKANNKIPLSKKEKDE